MAEQPTEGEQRGIPDSLRAAIEDTFSATARSAAGTRERAGELVDEVARRGQEARGAASRVIEAIEGMRLATRDDVRALEQRLDELSERVARVESKVEVES